MKLQTNESTPDRIIRVVLGVALLALAFAGIVGGAVAILAWVVGAIATRDRHRRVLPAVRDPAGQHQAGNALTAREAGTP